MKGFLFWLFLFFRSGMSNEVFLIGDGAMYV